MKRFLAIIAAALLIAGCTTADTTNESTKEFQTNLTFYVTGGSTINYNNEIQTESDSDSEINAENDPSMKIAPKTNLGLNGSPTLAEDGAEVLVDGLTHGVELLGGVTPIVTDAIKDVIKDETLEDALVDPMAPSENPPLVNSDESLMKVYDVDTYEDGRMRFLFRGTMENLPDQFSIYFKGEKIFDVDKSDTVRFSVSTEHGERWEENGKYNTIMKNSEGRAESITVLLSQEFGSNPNPADCELRGVVE